MGFGDETAPASVSEVLLIYPPDDSSNYLTLLRGSLDSCNGEKEALLPPSIGDETLEYKASLGDSEIVFLAVRHGSAVMLLTYTGKSPADLGFATSLARRMDEKLVAVVAPPPDAAQQ